ncbi:MAG: hypothetical protein U1C18_00890 [Patescibacteria group bacterium]|nr:hypothetical protein [Patescibacteria group bacterium]
MATKIQNKALLDTLQEQTGMSKNTAEKFRKEVGFEKHGTMTPGSALKKSRELYEAAQEGGYTMKKGSSKTGMQMGRDIYKKAYAQAKEQTKTAPGIAPKNEKPQRASYSQPQAGGLGLGVQSGKSTAISLVNPRNAGATVSLGAASGASTPQVSLGMPKK